MTTPRKEIVTENEIGVYHTQSRCVRRAFLCGEDLVSGRNFDHRKEWREQMLEKLSEDFAIDIIAFAIMSNHTHEIIRTRPDLAQQWEPEEVARRWLRIFPKRRPKGQAAQVAEEPTLEQITALAADRKRIDVLRKRLASLSWFMAVVNQRIARLANREDAVTGRFWEGRFKCQRLLDEQALLACMIYVDLNPIRAKMAFTIEDAEHTSAHRRLQARQAKGKLEAATGMDEGAALNEAQERLLEEQRQLQHTDAWLARIDNRAHQDMGAVPLSTDEYLALVDYTGRKLRVDKPGAVPAALAPVLQRLTLDVENWVENVRRYGGLFWRVAGRADDIAQAARAVGKKWFKGAANQDVLYGS